MVTMRFMVLAFVISTALSADIIQEAAPIVDEALVGFLDNSEDGASLSEIFGSDEKWLSQAENDFKTELAKEVKKALLAFLEKIKDHIEHGKAAGTELLEKIKELQKELKDIGVDLGDKGKEALQKIKAKAKEVLRKLFDKLSVGKRNLNEEMDFIARSQFRSIGDWIREEILSNENIAKFRKYVENIASNSPLAQELKEFWSKLTNEELREVLRHILEFKPGHDHSVMRAESFDKIKEFFKGLKIKITENTKKFGEWVKGKWGKGLDQMKEKYGAIRAIALEFINSADEVQAEVAREAIEFFTEYKEHVSDMYKQIAEAAEEAMRVS